MEEQGKYNINYRFPSGMTNKKAKGNYNYKYNGKRNINCRFP